MSDLPAEQHDSQAVTAVSVTQSVSQHLCPACEDEMSSAKASTLRQAGHAVVWTPAAITFFSWVDSLVRHVAWVPDERIVGSALIGLAAIIAFGFPTKEGTVVDLVAGWLKDKIKRKETKDE